jgi:hypothetical protein
LATLKDSLGIKNINVYTKGIYTDPTIGELINYGHKIINRSWRTIINPTIQDKTIDFNNIQIPIEVIYCRPLPHENYKHTIRANVSTYENYYIPAKVSNNTSEISLLSYNPSSVIFPNSVVYQTNKYDEILSYISFKISETQIYGGLINAGMFSKFSTYSRVTSFSNPNYLSSYVLDFSSGFQGDSSMKIRGFMDFAITGVKELTYVSNFISDSFMCDIVLSIRYINYYEPNLGKIKFYYSV